jgi:RimJ/RimL family protein N-acetyltransferase
VDAVIREATIADAAAIAGIHVRAWQAAYRGLIADEILDGQSVTERTATWQERLRAGDGAALPFTLVADRSGVVRGFCNAARLDQDADATIGALYLEPGHLRGGMGSALLGAALNRLHAGRLDDVVVWALEENRSGRAFYERFGFTLDGGREIFEGSPEIRMRACLAS